MTTISRSTSYMTTPRRSLSTATSGTGTPTLDAMRAQRSASSWGLPASPRLLPRSVSAAFSTTSGYETPRATSSTVQADTAGSSSAELSGNRTAALNFSMLEQRINKLEQRYEKHGEQLRSDLREWFESSFGGLEQAVTASLEKQQTALDEQHHHFSGLCAQNERKCKAVDDQARARLLAVQAELRADVDATAEFGKQSVAKQNGHLDVALQDLASQMQLELTTQEGRLASRIGELDADLHRKIDVDVKAVDDKYADVCIGLNNKLGSTQVQLDTRIDKVVDDVNKSLQVFDAEVDKSLKLLAAKIKEMDTSAVLRNEVLESKTDGLISNLQMRLMTEASKLGESAAKFEAVVKQDLAAQLAQQGAFEAETTKRHVEVAKGAKAELSERMESVMQKLEKLTMAQLITDERVAPIEAAIKDFDSILHVDHDGVVHKVNACERLIGEMEVDLNLIHMTAMAAS